MVRLSALPLGKLPRRILEKYVLPARGLASQDVVVEPSVGIDFAVLGFGKSFLVVSSDPVTGTVENIGWHAVHVSANDVATSGCYPRFLESVILLPEGATTNLLHRITTQMTRACRSVSITIVGGHTECTSGIVRPLVITSAFGFAEKFVTASGAVPGNYLMMTKSAGLEGTAILAREYSHALGQISRQVLNRAAGFFRAISIVREATIAFNTGHVTAMHDVTEGGVLGGLYEMSIASGVGFQVEEAKIPVAAETRILCKALRIDPLRLIGSGALLLAVEPSGVKTVADRLRAQGILVNVIGRVGGKKRIIIRAKGGTQNVREGVDEIWRLSGQYG